MIPDKESQMSLPTQDLTPGTKVEIYIDTDSPLYACTWWPAEGTVTGTVKKVHKNGKVAVAVDQLHNWSDDRRRILHFQASELVAK